MAAAAILKIRLNGHNSVAIARIRTKFGSETKTDVPETEVPSNLTSAKIQDGGRPPFWEHINCHNSAALWDIFTKMGCVNLQVIESASNGFWQIGCLGICM